AGYAAHLADHPTDPVALNNAGALALQSGNIDLAVTRFEKLVSLAPTQAHAYNNLGYALLHAGRLSEAIGQLERTVEIDPTYATAYNNLGIAYERDDRRSAAILAFERSLSLNPGYADAAANLGEVLNRDDETGRARAALQRALASRPQHMGALVALAAADGLDGHLKDARATLEALVPSRPRYSGFWQVLGSMRGWEGDFDAAERACRQAIALDPNDPLARFGVASSLLARGDYQRGWRAFEERREGVYGTRSRLGEFALWNGDYLDGTLLVYCEQGLGDVVQFARFIVQARARVRRVILLADVTWKCLEPVLTSLAGVDEIYTDRSNLPTLQDRPLARTSVLSLPYLLGIDAEALPGVAFPYLVAPADHMKLWAARLRAVPRPRVGVAWAAAVRRDIKYLTRQKSIPIAKFAGLLGVPAIGFVSLQLGGVSDLSQLGDIAAHVVDFTSDIRDFGDTAAIISQLDLIVSTDTSVAHVAGAMGKPVWLVDRFNACWRWRLADDTSPWYPTIRIFRQRQFADWSDPLARVAAELATLA
ncbi:MAG TPA: tetratricopeptide repeat protein, partial [Casimicrobiaceae bacterium]|nr:tetratricopeptide repeat protein [Casimicrobiaceae bacterium]